MDPFNPSAIAACRSAHQFNPLCTEGLTAPVTKMTLNYNREAIFVFFWRDGAGSTPPTEIACTCTRIRLSVPPSGQSSRNAGQSAITSLPEDCALVGRRRLQFFAIPKNALLAANPEPHQRAPAHMAPTRTTKGTRNGDCRCCFSGRRTVTMEWVNYDGCSHLLNQFGAFDVSDPPSRLQTTKPGVQVAPQFGAFDV